MNAQSKTMSIRRKQPRKRQSRQPELPGTQKRGRGGRREGAGRKPKGKRAGVSHKTRPFLDAAHPLHVTMRVVPGIARLRKDKQHRVIRQALCAVNGRPGFQVAEYSILGNHYHLVVEARTRAALSRGMQALNTRIARGLNGVQGRTGTVFADRYHARVLDTPRVVRNALVYVLQNARKHEEHRFEGWWELDPCSSAAYFTGWKDGPPPLRPPPDEPVIEPPRTWLLKTGWRRHGPISVDELPKHA